MIKTFILVLIASSVCTLQSTHVTLDLTDDIDGFIKKNTSEHLDNIAQALNYTLNVQYTALQDDPFTQIGVLINKLSATLSKVCMQSKILNCTIREIGLYILFLEPESSWTEKAFEPDKVNLVRQTKHEFNLCTITFTGNITVAEDIETLQKRVSKLDAIKSSPFELGFHISFPRKNQDSGRLTEWQDEKEILSILDHYFSPFPINLPNDVAESYQIFQDSLSRKFKLFAIVKNMFPGGGEPNCHLHIKFGYLSEISPNITIEYTKMFLKYVHTLVQKKKINVVISGVRIPDGCTRKDVVMETVVGKDVFPIPWLNSTDIHTAQLYPFPTFIVTGIEWAQKGQLNDENKPEFQTKNVLVVMDNIDTITNDIFKLLALNQSLPKSIRVTTLLFYPDEFQNVTKDLQLLNIIRNSGVKLGLYISLGNLKEYKGFNNTVRTLSDDPSVEVFLLTLHIDVGVFLTLPTDLFHTRYKNDIRMPLIRVYDDSRKYQKEHPNIKIIIHLTEPSNAYYNVPSCNARAYCNVCFKIINEIFEGILIGAKLHDVPIVLKEMVSKPYIHYRGWYEYLHGFKNEVTVSRNQPIIMVNEQTACIHPTENLPQKGIQFHSNMSGITVNGILKIAQNNSLNPDELRLMTAFAVSKSNMVEILLEQGAECNAATNAEKLLKTFKPHCVENGPHTNLFLDFPLQSLDKTSLSSQINCFKNLTKTISNVINEHVFLSGVHISNWKVMKNFTEILPHTKSLNMNLGITIENCYDLRRAVNSCDAPLNKVDYIVCRFEYFKPSNSDRGLMSEQLDFVLYISKIFKKLCPQLQVYFRLTSRKLEKVQENLYSSSIEFLKFVGDWVKFTEKYNIPIFLVETVDHFDEGNVGWWRVNNWADLTNPQVYVDKEADFLNKSASRPPFLEPPPKRNVNEGKGNTPNQTNVVEGFVAIVVIVAITVVVVSLLKFFGRKRRILTEEQIRATLDGSNSFYHTYMTLLSEQEASVIYDKAYEISKGKFKFANEIPLGSGNFGDVFKARVGDNLVAVKKPKATCTGHGLISMLEEIKILCHIGTHEHVLRFVGCCTKHASAGLIYIATELCENGCLQKYLIDIKPNIEGEDCSNLHLYQLNKFSFEIASGMEYITSRKIIHSDLATRNVLLDSNMMCKIGDFGLSRKLYANVLYEKEGHDPMPWRWLAIESLKRREYSSASDVWSYGVTIWEIFSFGELPYPKIKSVVGFTNLIQDGLRLNNPTFMPETIFKTIFECWNSESCDRPSFTQLKEYFRGILAQVYTEI